MPRTGGQLLRALSEYIDDYVAGTTTSAGNAGGTTLVDTALSIFGDNKLLGQFVRLSNAPYTVRRIISSAQSSGTVTAAPAFTAAVAVGTAYEVHRYDPRKKFLALDKARLEDSCMDKVYRTILNEDITSDGTSTAYPIPSAMEQGPHIAYVEDPVATSQGWNFLTNPLGDSATSWTATNATRTTITTNTYDLLIPKYGSACTKLTIAANVNGTHTQAVASMANGITASISAGRKMTYATWLYCTEPDRLTLRITDDLGTSTGSAHRGNGWQLLWVEREIVGNNATTLTVTVDVASSPRPLAIFWNRGWFYFGSKERVVDSLFNERRTITVRRDDTEQQVLLGSIPPRGYQIRLSGKAPLTALGSAVTARSTILDLAPSALWGLGEASGASAADATGNANTGTITIGAGALDYRALDVDGDGSVDFDGSATIIDCASAAGIDNIWDGGGTLTFLVSADSVSTDNARLASKQNAGATTGWNVRFISSQLNFEHLFTSTGRWATTQTFTNGISYAITITFNANSPSNDPTMYVTNLSTGLRTVLTVGDGLTEAATPSGTRTSDASDTFKIGGGSSTFFNGRLDEVAVWKGRVLSADEESLISGAAYANQATKSMEVDEKTQEIIVAYAAKQLFEWEKVRAEDVPRVAERINAVMGRIPGTERAWGYTTPKPSLLSPWAR